MYTLYNHTYVHMTPQILQPIIGEPKEGPSIAGFHKIVDFFRCPQEWKFRHIIQIEPKNKEEKTALQIGVLAHIGRADFFAKQCKGTVDSAHKAIQKYVQKSGGVYKAEAEREACRLMSAYIEHWSAQPLPLVRAVEYEIGPAPLAINDPLYAFRTARLDDLSNYPDALNKLCIGDLKTTSDSISATMNEYRQNGQFITYNILYRMAKEGQLVFGPIHGIMIDICTKEAVPKFHRELITVTPFQEKWFTAAMQAHLRVSSQITTRTPTPRNVTQCARSVSRKGSFMCDYHDLCHYGGSRVNMYTDKQGEYPAKELVEI